jgi:hypothetical protein
VSAKAGEEELNEPLTVLGLLFIQSEIAEERLDVR